MSGERAAGERRRGLRVGSLFGIEIRLDPSVMLIFALIVFMLATGVFPKWHPDWSAGQAWGLALAAGLLFFASLLAHELAHSVVAILHGVPVPRITLFLFGGVSEMSREPDSPRAEFLIAVVGPAMSLLLGAIFTAAGAALAGDAEAAGWPADPEALLSGLSPLATMLFWLGPVNLMLGVFNLVPGFPLDGGRVLRSALWWLTGDVVRATRWASLAGQAVAWGLIVLGVVQVLSGLLQGLWLMLIGWFLNNAARSSLSQLLVRQAIEGLNVGDLMRTRFERVGEDVLLETFVHDHLLRSSQTCWPVTTDDGELLGIVTFDEIREVPAERRRELRVGDVMTSVEETVAPGLSGRAALEILLRQSGDPLPVIQDGRIVGMLRRADILRWLAMHQLESTQS